MISFRMITRGHMEIDHMWGAREGAVEVAQVEGDEVQNEGSGSPGLATCWLCNHQELVSDYMWMTLERHVMITRRFLLYN